MTPAVLKVAVVLLIFFGEALAVTAELVGAQQYNILHGQFLPIFLRMFLVIMGAGALLVAGYIFGLRAFQNIWIVSVLSWASILLVEPFLSYTLFAQLPTRGAWIGMAFALAGMASALFL
jgi:hypothetical protein